MSNLVKGTIQSSVGGKVVFCPLGSNYELELVSSKVDLKPGDEVNGVVSAKARKVWTIAAGGGFIQPLHGEMRVLQGRVVGVEGKTIIVQAGGPRVCLELPEDPAALDLKNGALTVGALVNVTLFPGASLAVA